ncbi:hypothetical protein LDR44_004639 [Salmonella enterica]|nr:hypothetical protein [Salmonella enterica]EFR3658172.1 hypothetical protein [Salmonella enterica]EIE7706030.1 hypothetical protein [Salmonella enterica]EIN2108355.1 hypothetical protein [Salmonella enterica]EIO8764907.1 hypothetical protein [Salmonella enterica]
MDRRDCMCLFILTLISHLITEQESWMVYLVNATIFDRYLPFSCPLRYFRY